MRKQYQHQVEGSSGPIHVIIQDMFKDVEKKHYDKRYYNVSGHTDNLTNMLPLSIVTNNKIFNVTITTPPDPDELSIETLMALVAVRLKADSSISRDRS